MNAAARFTYRPEKVLENRRLGIWPLIAVTDPAALAAVFLPIQLVVFAVVGWVAEADEHTGIPLHLAGALALLRQRFVKGRIRELRRHVRRLQRIGEIDERIAVRHVRRVQPLSDPQLRH